MSYNKIPNLGRRRGTSPHTLSGSRYLFKGSRSTIPRIFYVYYAFIFSLPFEAADIGIGKGYFTLSKMIAYVLIGYSLFNMRLCFQFPHKAFWFFAIYLYVYFNWSVFLEESAFASQAIKQLFTLFQLLILFWISYNFMRAESTGRGTLLTLAASCVVLAVLQALGVTGEIGSGGRVTAFGTNPG